MDISNNSLVDPNDLIEEEKEIIPIELWESQVPHYLRLCEIMKTWIAFLDTSPMGAGKTITTLALCATFKLNLVVVGPLSTLSMWEEMSKLYGINIKLTLSYQKLAGTKIKGCAHPLLYRDGDTYSATEFLRNLIREGTLFIFDESHTLRNEDTAQLHAAHHIVKTVKSMNCGSRIGLLSATPGDKKDHVASILKMLGIITNEKLYDYNHKTKVYILLGMNQLYDYCKTIDNQTANAIIIPTTRFTANQMCYDLFIGIVKLQLVSSMEKPTITAIKDGMNGYYDMPSQDVDTIRQAEASLKKATSFNEETGTVDIRNVSWGAIVKAQQSLERGKLRTMIRLVTETLNNNPNSKVILYVWFLESIEYLRENLRQYNPLVMFGKTKKDERTNIRNLFQQDDLNHRLLISNAKVGGIGISLDDRSGTKPRFMFMIPTYNFIDLHQATGRIHRGTTKSNATIRFIYSKAFRGEVSILKAIAKKTEITKSILYNSNNIVFPGDYDSHIENEGIIPNPNKINNQINNLGQQLNNYLNI